MDERKTGQETRHSPFLTRRIAFSGKKLAAWIHYWRTDLHRAVKIELILSSLAINILMLAMPIVTLQVYDRVISHKGDGTMLMLTLGIVGVVVVDTTLRIARSYVTDEGAAAFEFLRTERLMERTTQAWVSDAEKLHVGDYVQALGAVSRMKEYAASRLLTLAVDGPFLVLFIGVLAYIGGWLVLAPLALMGIFTIMIWHTGRQLLGALARSDQLDTQRYSYILESLQGIQTVKSLGVEAMFARRFRMMLARSSRVAARVALLNQRLAALGAMFAQGVIIVVLAAGAPLVVMGHVTLGGLIACVLLSGRLIQPLQHALVLWIHHQEYRQALARLKRMDQLVTQPFRALEEDGWSTEAAGGIELHNVIYARDVTQPPLFYNLNLSVAPGEIVGLRGREGAGRGILLQLVAGMMAPQQGTVRIHGLDPAELSGEALMKQVAYLPAEAVLFRGTIMENLTGFDPSMEDRAREISRLLGLESLIVRLPQGYDTLLEGGTSEMISPGFCQRIAMAQALRCKPKIILFDRADRSLDREGYQHVYHLLARLKGKASVLMVSDDENLIRLCDRLYLLDEANLRPLRTQSIGRPRPRLTLLEPGEVL